MDYDIDNSEGPRNKQGRQRVVDRVARNKGVTLADVPGAQRSSVYL